MAHLHRLIVALLLCVAAGASFAALSPQPVYTSRGLWTGAVLGPASLGDICDAQAAEMNANGTSDGTYSYTASLATGNCRVLRSDGGVLYVSVTAQGNACPANSTQNAGGSCDCKSGYEEKDGMCKPAANDCEKLAGQSAGDRAFEGRADEHFACDSWNSAGGGKCVVKIYAEMRYENPPGSGHWISAGRSRYTGQTGSSCNGDGSGDGSGAGPSTPKSEDGKPPDTPDPGTSAPTPCPTGQAPGEVNGQRVCAPRGTDGKVEEKSTSSSTNAAGDKTDTTKETKCDGGQCTTTTTNCTTPNGQTSSNCTSTSTTGSASGTCKAGSGLAICGEGSTQTGFSGNCAAGFKAVSEDAVINAMAEETYRQNCKVNPDEASQALAKANVDKEGSQTGTLPGNAAVSIGPGSFDTSDALGGGAACMPDLTVSVLGRPQTLPFSVLCDYLGYMGGVLLAVSFLLAARIVTRG